MTRRTDTAICIFVIAVFLLVFGALVLPTANPFERVQVSLGERIK